MMPVCRVGLRFRSEPQWLGPAALFHCVAEQQCGRCSMFFLLNLKWTRQCNRVPKFRQLVSYALTVDKWVEFHKLRPTSMKPNNSAKPHVPAVGRRSFKKEVTMKWQLSIFLFLLYLGTGLSSATSKAGGGDSTGVVIAHADDWQLFVGDIIGQRLQQGKKVVIIQVTTGIPSTWECWEKGQIASIATG